MSEMDKLEAYLKEKGFNYEHIVRPEEKEDGYILQTERNMIVLNDENGEYLWDAICHYGSYGYEQGLLEIYGTLVNEEKDGDSVKGWLTAEDVIKRIEEQN